MQTRTKLLVIAGVLNIIGVLFFAYSAYAMIHNVAGITETVTGFVVEQYGNEKTTYYLNFVTNYFIISAIINAITALVFFVYAKFNIKLFTKFKTLLIILLVISALFGINLVSLILAGSALHYASFEKQPHPSHAQLGGVQAFYNQTKLKNTTERIEYIKKLKKEGRVSEEEYHRLLDEIIVNSIK